MCIISFSCFSFEGIACPIRSIFYILETNLCIYFPMKTIILISYLLTQFIERRDGTVSMMPASSLISVTWRWTRMLKIHKHDFTSLLTIFSVTSINVLPNFTYRFLNNHFVVLLKEFYKEIIQRHSYCYVRQPLQVYD